MDEMRYTNLRVYLPDLPWPTFRRSHYTQKSLGLKKKVLKSGRIVGEVASESEVDGVSTSEPGPDRKAYKIPGEE